LAKKERGVVEGFFLFEVFYYYVLEMIFFLIAEFFVPFITFSFP